MSFLRPSHNHSAISEWAGRPPGWGPGSTCSGVRLDADLFVDLRQSSLQAGVEAGDTWSELIDDCDFEDLALASDDFDELDAFVDSP